MIILVEGNREVEESEKIKMPIEEQYDLYEKQGFSKNEIIKKIAKNNGVSKNEIYMKFVK